MFRNIKSEANNSPELTDYMTLCGKIGKRRFEIRYRNIPMRPTVRDNGFVAVHIFDNWVVWFSAGKKKDKNKKDSAIRPPLTLVLYIFVGFWLLAHLTRDLFQAEKKITAVTSWATDKMTTIFTQNDNHFEWNRCHFVHLLSL